MTFELAYFIGIFACAAALGITGWIDYRRGHDITLGAILLAVAGCLIPLFNIFVAITVGGVILFNELNTVVIKGKGK